MKSIFILLFTFSAMLFSQQQPVDYVNPMIGTSNSRWMVFPGPAMPFGMVKLSPDNQKNVWNGGYEYTINSIAGFSHIHSWAMGGLSVMPVTGEKTRTFPGPADGPFKGMWTSGYRSRFYKDEEKASLGYYKVKLYDHDVLAELTATTRCGYLRFTYPQSESSRILFNFNFEYEENDPAMIEAYVKKVSDTEIEGYTKMRSSFADVYTVHFVARFSKPLKNFQSWQMKPFDGKNLYGTNWQREVVFFNDNEKMLTGDCGALVTFSTEQDEVIEMQTGISLVSIDQARLNLDTEMKPFGWNFQKVVDNCRNEWNNILSRIDVTGGSEVDKEKFYTGLYRAYASRTIWNDVNGKYIDMCEKTQQLKAPADNIYGCDGFWGSHWNLFPLWTTLTPDIANSWINSLLEFYDKGGWLPQGPEGIEYCEVMVGAHQIKLIISAYQKGIRDFDVQKAYEAMKKNQMIPGINHPCGGWAGNKNLESILKYGYVANEDGPVSNTLETAFDDWALAQMAKTLDKSEDYNYFMKRSQNYKNIFDPETKFMRQRHADGRWVQEWDSLYDHGTWYGSGYVEGTAWHYTFFVPHDYPGLINLAGRELLIWRLEEGFQKGYIDIGNQPNMQAPYIFNYLGAPWLTQKYATKSLQEAYDNTPLRGYPGEEDQGQMSAFFVLGAMGLFQMDGGCSVEPYYDLSTPLFDEIVIHLDEKYYSGKTFTIKTEKQSPQSIYISDIHLNGKKINQPRLMHKDFIKGGELLIKLQDEPDKTFGVE
jgi:predicted alpha-1,2-mannosidase